MADLTIREGATEPVTFQCQQLDPATGVASAVDLTNYTAPALQLRKLETGDDLSFTPTNGKFDFGTRTNGETIFAPAATDLSAGNYEAFVKVTNSSGKIVEFPSDKDFELRVLKTY